MAKKLSIRYKYNPALSIKENAKRNGVTEAIVRNYIQRNLVDRRHERKQVIIDACRKYLKNNPQATKTEISKKLGYTLVTLRKYWEYITSEKELIDFNQEKIKKYQSRQANDFYATHHSCTSDILREESFGHYILEPFCGTGTMSKTIEASGRSVESYDIVDRGYGGVADFFKLNVEEGKLDIITNPPYNDRLAEIISRCIKLCRQKVAILMPLRYLSSNARYNDIYKNNPPARVYVYQERICIAKNGDFETYNDAGANLEIYAWYIWEKGYIGEPILRWIHNEK